jgi:hypothetical protein
MKIMQSFGAALSYLFDGFVELFSPDHDNYPSVGVQPFEGEVYAKWTSSLGYKSNSK